MTSINVATICGQIMWKILGDVECNKRISKKLKKKKKKRERCLEV